MPFLKGMIKEQAWFASLVKKEQSSSMIYIFRKSKGMSRKPRSFFDMQFVTSSISTMLVLLLLGIVVFS